MGLGLGFDAQGDVALLDGRRGRQRVHHSAVARRLGRVHAAQRRRFLGRRTPCHSAALVTLLVRQLRVLHDVEQRGGRRGPKPSSSSAAKHHPRGVRLADGYSRGWGWG